MAGFDSLVLRKFADAQIVSETMADRARACSLRFAMRVLLCFCTISSTPSGLPFRESTQRGFDSICAYHFEFVANVF